MCSECPCGNTLTDADVEAGESRCEDCRIEWLEVALVCGHTATIMAHGVYGETVYAACPTCLRQQIKVEALETAAEAEERFTYEELEAAARRFGQRSVL